MPLRQDKWSEGKCGFKALQYMALGIPALVSPVGVNSKIVDHGVNGFICETENDWVKYILELHKNRDKLVELGRNTREKIVKNYSHLSNRDNFVLLFM
jgi:glycosyltransferase involved in cell wall biosynthesis